MALKGKTKLKYDRSATCAFIAIMGDYKYGNPKSIRQAFRTWYERLDHESFILTLETVKMNLEYTDNLENRSVLIECISEYSDRSDIGL